MRAAVERFARRWWEGELGAAGRALSAIAAPASWTWSALSSARSHAGARSATRIPGLRVVSVGNLAVGGTGKTPLVRWVAKELEAGGAAPCVLVGSAAADEAELHRRWNPGVPVLVDRDRAASAARARAAGHRTAVLDDGFHHTTLARELDIALISADDPFPGAVLPSGPYREPTRALARAGMVVVTRRSASAERAAAVASLVERGWPGLLAGVLAIQPGALARLDGSPAPAPSGTVLAVVGVARPHAFARAAEQVTDRPVELLAFADHHAYAAREVERIRRRSRGRTVVTTEKDAVKLERWASTLGEVVVLHDRLQWERGEDVMRARLRALALEAREAA
jgi:tetraacyldisaccharide 4'-kinase